MKGLVININQNEARRENPLLDRLQMAGVNHRTATLALREKVALPAGGRGAFLEDLRQKLGIEEVVALSTCNRTEFYWASSQPVHPLVFFQALPKIKPDDLKTLEASIYHHQGQEAAEHLFRVACGIDSLVVGETQIINQVKRAYELSRGKKFTKASLNLLFQTAFEVAKKVHSNTRLSAQRASVPSVALKLTEAIFDDLDDCNVLVIGTGEIAGLTVEALRKRGAKNISFITRTEERARVWKESHQGSRVTTIENLPDVLPEADIVISCTMTQKPVISRTTVQKALHDRGNRRRPLLLLDLGIPRNIEPEVARLPQVYLHDIDDLQQVVEKNRCRLEAEIEKARVIIDEVLENYIKGCRGSRAGETIRDLRSFADEVARMEIERTMKKLSDLSPRQRREIETLVTRVLGKVLHPPTENLRLESSNGQAEEAIEWARKLFGLSPLDLTGKCDD